MPTRSSTYALVELTVRGKTCGCQGALPAARRCTELRDQIFTVEAAAPEVGHARTVRVRRANPHHLAPLSARVARASLALQRLSAHAHRSQPIEASRPHRLAASRRRGRPSHTLPSAGEFGNASNMSGVRCKGSNPLSAVSPYTHSQPLSDARQGVRALYFHPGAHHGRVPLALFDARTLVAGSRGAGAA